jgi:hypothetical protein
MKIRVFFASLLILSVLGCTDGEGARRILIEQNYHNVDITGYDTWGCPRDDYFSTGFTATSPNGTHVEGVVCEAAFGYMTVRIK